MENTDNNQTDPSSIAPTPLPETPKPAQSFTTKIIALVVLIIIIVGIIVLLSHHSSKMSAQSPMMTASSTPMLFTYSLPSGWTSLNNPTGEGEQAVNTPKDYVFSAATVPVPASAGNITTITQVMTTADMSQVVASEFPGATTTVTTMGTLDGEQAIITKFNAQVAENTSPTATSTIQSKPLALTQYDAIHNGVLYILVFMSLPTDKTAAALDFQEIVSSFKYTDAK